MAKVGRPIGRAHQEDVRKKIQASQLVNLLQNHALNGTELAMTRIKAAELLLRKSIPDLTAVEHSGNEDNPINHRVQFEIIDGKE